MKNWLFGVISTASGGLIAANVSAGTAVANLVAGLSNGLTVAMAYVSGFLLQLIDKRRYEHSTAMRLQYHEMTELALLRSASQVCDDAVQRGMWTRYHTIAFNQIANNLCLRCGWQADSVHEYLGGLVGNIPGLSYYGSNG